MTQRMGTGLLFTIAFGFLYPISLNAREQEYLLTADKLNALYGICANLTPLDLCMNRVEHWLTDFIK